MEMTHKSLILLTVSQHAPIVYFHAISGSEPLCFLPESQSIPNRYFPIAPALTDLLYSAYLFG